MLSNPVLTERMWYFRGKNIHWHSYILLGGQNPQPLIIYAPGYETYPSYPSTVMNDRMWHFMGVKTFSDPSYIYSGGPYPPTSRTCPGYKTVVTFTYVILFCFFWCLTEVHAYPPQKQYEPDLPEYMWLFLTTCQRSSSSCFQQRYIFSALPFVPTQY